MNTQLTQFQVLKLKRELAKDINDAQSDLRIEVTPVRILVAMSLEDLWEKQESLEVSTWGDAPVDYTKVKN